jgi:hypothetical protein
MTDLQPAVSTTLWDTEFQRLRDRFPKAPVPGRFCIHVLQQDPDIALDDLKAQAHMHGIRVTGWSLHSARRHLTGQPPPGRGSESRRLRCLRLRHQQIRALLSEPNRTRPCQPTWPASPTG